MTPPNPTGKTTWWLLFVCNLLGLRAAPLEKITRADSAAVAKHPHPELAEAIDAAVDSPIAATVSTVIYPWGGVDVVGLLGAFPNASFSILLGREPIDPPPSITAVPTESEVVAALAKLENSRRSDGRGFELTVRLLEFCRRFGVRRLLRHMIEKELGGEIRIEQHHGDEIAFVARLPTRRNSLFTVRYLSVDLEKQSGLKRLTRETISAVRDTRSSPHRVALMIKACEFQARQEPAEAVVTRLASSVDVIVQDVTGLSVTALRRIDRLELYALGEYSADGSQDGIFKQPELEALFNSTAVSVRRSLGGTRWGHCRGGVRGTFSCTVVVGMRARERP